jgi:hypothetical protein
MIDDKVKRVYHSVVLDTSSFSFIRTLELIDQSLFDVEIVYARDSLEMCDWLYQHC